jgi:membrane protein
MLKGNARLLIAVAVTYHLAASVRQPFVVITPGAVLAVAVWIAATIGFTFYLESFGSRTYGATYGSLGGVIVLLLYIFISASVRLLGA